MKISAITVQERCVRGMSKVNGLTNDSQTAHLAQHACHVQRLRITCREELAKAFMLSDSLFSKARNHLGLAESASTTRRSTHAPHALRACSGNVRGPMRSDCAYTCLALHREAQSMVSIDTVNRS